MAQDPIQSTNQFDESSSDSDLFIPQQIAFSSDDEQDQSTTVEIKASESKSELLDDESRDEISLDEKPDSSTEEQSQSSSQENHELEAPVVAEPAPIVKPKNRRNKKKAKKVGKGTKEKTKVYDEMSYLDECIEQNQKSQVTASKPTIDEKKEQERKSELAVLRLKLKDRKAQRAAAKIPVIRMVEPKPSTIGERIEAGLQEKKRMLARAKKITVSNDGKVRASDLLDLHQKATTIGGQQYPVQANSFSVNPENRVKILMAKYEDMVAAGKMTVEDAVDLIFQGKDITEPIPGLGEFDDDEEKRRQTEYYYRMIAQMDPMSNNRFRSNIPDLIKSISNEFIDHSVDEHGYIDMLHIISKAERSINEDIDPEDSVNTGAWRSMCNIFYEKFKDKMQLNTPTPITDPILYYQDALKNYVAQMMLNDLDRMDQSGVFKRYNPKERPLILCCFQKHIADMFPSTQIVLDMNKVIEAGFAPKKALTFTPFGSDNTIVAYGLFWSFSCSFSLFGNFYRAPDGSFRYFWIIFDRVNQSIDSILDPPHRAYREKLTEAVENGKTILNYEHEVIDIETGSSTQLENAMTVDSEGILDQTFMQEVSDTLEQTHDFPIQVARPSDTNNERIAN